MSTRRKRLSHQMHTLAPRIRFRKYEALAGGLLVTSLTGTGAWIGYREGKTRLESAQDHMESMKALETMVIRISKKTIRENFPEKSGDKCEQQIIGLLKEKGVKDGEIQRKLELVDQYRNILINSNLRQLLGSDVADAGLTESNENVTRYTAYGGGMGLALGLLFAYISMTEMRKHRILVMRKNEKARLDEIIRKREEQKAKQKEEETIRITASGTFIALQPSEPIKMKVEESLVSPDDKSKRKGVSLEKAIRKVCGKKCSPDVADAIASCLPASISEWIIENPSNLKQVLEENKEKLNGYLELTGWTTEEVLKEIFLQSSRITGEYGPIRTQEQKFQELSGPLNLRAMRQLRLLKKARETPRGIDRKDLHELASCAGFTIVPGKGGHQQIEYRGEHVRTEDGRPVIIVRKSSGDLPYGTVNQMLDHLIRFLEKKF